jgi:hypothetical protein
MNRRAFLSAVTLAPMAVVANAHPAIAGPDPLIVRSSAGPISVCFDQLKSAQSVYTSNLALAQAGDVDALASIARDFENYRAAAKALYLPGRA